MPWLDVTVTLSLNYPQEQPVSQIREAWEKARLLIDPSRKIAPSSPEIFPFSLNSTIPLGAGFGSSAALCLCLLDAAAVEKGFLLTQTERIAKATELESIFHGRSSGLDPTVIALRKPIRFTMEEGAQALSWGLDDFAFVLATGPEARQTSQAVAKVRSFAEKKPKCFQEKIERAKHLIGVVEELLIPVKADSRLKQQQRAELLGKQLDLNHSLLQDLGISTPKIDHLVQKAREYGALGAKLSGAGLGGSILALAPIDLLPSLQKILLKEGAIQASIALPSKS